MEEGRMFLDEAMEAGRRAATERERLLPARMLERRLDGDGGRVRSFKDAVARADGSVSIIAEVKRMSPSRGAIRPGAEIGEIARAYESAGAAAVSVLTSQFGFLGHVDDLVEAKAACTIPVLCKDFISSEYQVLEARVFGASAVLLIAEALETAEAAALLRHARSHGLDVLFEAHSLEGMARAPEVGAGIIGINNRDLETLEVDLGTTQRLFEYVPDGALVVSESGIRTREDVVRMAALGVDALLVGEALMSAEEPGERLRELVGGDRKCG
jgi:indole-3-glycerol phosphate synthase